MSDLLLPRVTARPPVGPEPRVRVLRRSPLAAIHESLGWSLHDVINDPSRRPVVLWFYKTARRIRRDREMDRIRRSFAWRVFVRDGL